MKTIAVVLFFLLSIQFVELKDLAVQDKVYAFSSSNATVDNGNEFKFRTTNLLLVDVQLLGAYGVYYSASLDAMKTGQGSGTISGDVIIGAVKIVVGSIPSSFLGYIAASTNVSLTASGLQSASFAAAGAFIFHAVLRVEERNPAGNTVRSIDFKTCTWVIGGSNDTSKHLKYMTVSTLTCNNLIFGTESISFVFFVSDTLGKIDLTGNGYFATVTPKTLESAITINGWSYADKANSLSLIFGTVTGAMAQAGSLDAGTGNVLVAGSGANQVYAQYATVASINGNFKNGNVQISHADVANITAIVEDPNTGNVITAVYKGIGGVSAKQTTVSFPAGASNIVYDPTIGNGDYVKIYSDAKTLVFSILLFVVVALI